MIPKVPKAIAAAWTSTSRQVRPARTRYALFMFLSSSAEGRPCPAQVRTVPRGTPIEPRGQDDEPTPVCPDLFGLARPGCRVQRPDPGRSSAGNVSGVLTLGRRSF